MRTHVEIGQALTCAETGKQFIAAQDGCTFNYAQDDHGHIYSDEGVNIRQRRELLDRTRPFICYVSNDGRNVTGWKGNFLGTITRDSVARLTRWSHWHGQYIHCYRVRDVHGGHWYGRGSPGIAITLRATKR